MGKGQTHAHGVAKCPNCRGPHTEKPNLWPKEKEARRAAKGCRLCHHVAGRVQQRPPNQLACLRRPRQRARRWKWRCKPQHRTGFTRWKSEGLRARLYFFLCLYLPLPFLLGALGSRRSGCPRRRMVLRRIAGRGQDCSHTMIAPFLQDKWGCADSD